MLSIVTTSKLTAHTNTVHQRKGGTPKATNEDKVHLRTRSFAQDGSDQNNGLSAVGIRVVKDCTEPSFSTHTTFACLGPQQTLQQHLPP
mmetsp:Transcript_32920/g.53432  ORF Transcript_32920/g.53432 Transcript_32920/m.53432 type:complete len:89 (+) Transcript_32920:58-324(+)